MKPTRARSENIFIVEDRIDTKCRIQKRRRKRGPKSSLDLYFKIIGGGLAGTVERKRRKSRVVVFLLNVVFKGK